MSETAQLDGDLIEQLLKVLDRLEAVLTAAAVLPKPKIDEGRA